MADIELVIKISQETFKSCKKECETTDAFIIDTFTYAIGTGKSLPKGHGRLFDERDIVNGNYEVIGNRIYELEPIIEADKESE